MGTRNKNLINNKDLIIKMYEVDRISTAAIGKKFNVTDHTVSSYLKSLGCNVSRKRSRTPILSNYFEKIDTQNKAYFLGLIAADGSVFQCNKGKIVFSISLIDKDLLDLLSIEICGSDKLVREVKRKYRDGSSKMYEIKFSDEIFTNNLISNGILINKTFTLDFPNIDEEFISHYIRGYLDGDGTVYKFSGKLFIAFYGNKIFIPKLRDYLFNNNILETKYAIIDRGNHCSIHISSKKANLSMYNYIYNNSNIYLKRKKSIFDFALCTSDGTDASGNIGEGCNANTEITK